MANPRLETFRKQVKGDTALLQRFSACPNLNAIAALGEEMGFSFTGVDLQGHLWLAKIVWG